MKTRNATANVGDMRTFSHNVGGNAHKQSHNGSHYVGFSKH